MSGLFGDAIPESGDLLGRCYTPDRIALSCIELLVTDHGVRVWPDELVVEPSVGDGGFARPLTAMWPHAHLHVVDVAPTAKGLRYGRTRHCGDWLTHASQVPALHGPPRLVVGNPPFDDPKKGDPARARNHLEAAFDTGAATIGFILPLEYVALSGWGRRMEQLAGFHPFEGRIWPFLRGAAFYVWRPVGGGVTPTVFRRLAS